MQRAARCLLSKLPKPPKPPKPISQSLRKPYKIFQNPPKSNIFTFSPFPISTQLKTPIKNRRDFSSGSGSGDHSAEIDEINLKFAEAREEIEAAADSKETVYFDEEAECAREAVRVVLDKFDGLMGRLEEKEKMALQRSMGLKIEQLKAELNQLDE